MSETAADSPCSLGKLRVGEKDSLGAKILDVLFRGDEYAIYRSERGIYVHFSDKPDKERDQRLVYSRLCVDICELRYLTSQMRPSRFSRWFGSERTSDLLYDHNMAQALMLAMESVDQREHQMKEADETENSAKAIAKRALDMAVRRNTTDNTIRYVMTGVLWAALGIAVAGAILYWKTISHPIAPYLLAGIMGLAGAVFSVIVRAQTFALKPCDDSGMNKMMSVVRIGLGGIAGPVLLLLLNTVLTNSMTVAAGADFLKMAALVGIIGGFVERLVPNLVQGVAASIESRAGTPGQATRADDQRGGGAPSVGIPPRPAEVAGLKAA